jgi:peptide alpha-N-acetyltransferase
MVSESVYKDLNKQNKKHFKELVKIYDNKMYKKSMKLCDKIIESQPTHGETLAMKALIYNTIGKKNEAKEWINKALM